MDSYRLRLYSEDMNNNAATLTLAPVARRNRLTGAAISDAYAVLIDEAGKALAEGYIDYTRAEVAGFVARRDYELDAVTVRACHHPGGHDKDADAEHCAHLLAAPSSTEDEHHCICDHCRDAGTCFGCTSGLCP